MEICAVNVFCFVLLYFPSKLRHSFLVAILFSVLYFFILLNCKGPSISGKKSLFVSLKDCVAGFDYYLYIATIWFHLLFITMYREGLEARIVMERDPNMGKEKVVSNSTLHSSSTKGFKDKSIPNNNIPSWLLTNISGMH